MQAIAERILPQSTIELLPFLALAITAGLFEEFLSGDREWLCWGTWIAGLGCRPSFVHPLWIGAFIQGRGGFFSTLVIGTVFGTGRIAYNSWYP